MRILKDARDYQILFLSSFLLVGVWTRDFTVQTAHLIAVLSASLVTQYLINRLDVATNSGGKLSLRSAWITGLSLCLLLRANSMWTMLFAGVISIACKKIFRFRNKHFFNPSNFGIIVAILVTSDAWITPGQWGGEVLYAFLFIATGAMVVRKVGRMDTTATFFLVYGGMEAARNAWLGWTWDVYLHRMTSGALLLFAFFMITDPRSIPDRKPARVAWVCLVSVLAFVLRNYYFVSGAILWALFIVSPLTILFDILWPAARFQWQKPVRSHTAAAPVAAAEGGVR